jgi:type II secretory pathway pseudopilin PulG
MAPRGFTLLELMLYLGILSFMSVILAGSFVSLTSGRAQSEARTEVDANIRFAVEHVIRDITGATGVVVPGVGGTGSSLQLTAGSDTIVYALSGGALQRTLNAGAAERLTSDRVVIDAFTVTRSDNYNSVLVATTTTISILLTVRYNSTASEWSYTSSMRASATLR